MRDIPDCALPNCGVPAAVMIDGSPCCLKHTTVLRNWHFRNDSSLNSETEWRNLQNSWDARRVSLDSSIDEMLEEFFESGLGEFETSSQSDAEAN